MNGTIVLTLISATAIVGLTVGYMVGNIIGERRVDNLWATQVDDEIKARLSRDTWTDAHRLAAIPAAPTVVEPRPEPVHWLVRAIHHTPRWLLGATAVVRAVPHDRVGEPAQVVAVLQPAVPISHRGTGVADGSPGHVARHDGTQPRHVDDEPRALADDWRIPTGEWDRASVRFFTERMAASR